MLMNGIDYQARQVALETAGIDPDANMDQFQTVLDKQYVYCNQHHNVHRTDGSCTVGVREQFTLNATGDFDAALTEARERGFRIYGEPTECRNCGQGIKQPSHSWVTVEDNNNVCPQAHLNRYGNHHTPVENLPEGCSTIV